MKKLIVGFLIFLSFSLAGQPVLAKKNPSLSVAQEKQEIINENAPDCFSLDIVFVIDQSKSMSEPPHPNDPNGQRYFAPRYALDWLANNRLSRLGQCPDAVHRIGVVSFGTEANIDLPMTLISPNSQGDWEKTLTGLQDQIKGSDMGKTDTIKGIETGIKLLRDARPLGHLPRKRALILVTDGQPCTESLGGNCSDTLADPQETVSQYMNGFGSTIGSSLNFSDAVKIRDDAIQEAVTQFGGADKVPVEIRDQIIKTHPVTNQQFFDSVYIWIIATNEATKYSASVGDIFKQITKAHNGELIDLSQTLNETPRLFNQIMSKLAGISPALLKCGNIAVDPYLSGVILDIYKVANGLEVELKLNGKSLKNGKGDTSYFGLAQYSTYGAVEHYRFQNPPAGLWNTVCSDPNGAQVSYLPFNASVKKLEPASVIPQYNVENVPSDPLHPYYLSYKIVNQTDDSPLNLDPNYPLDLKATITDPSGEKYELPLSFATDGVWKSKDPVHVNLTGIYQISILGQAPCVAEPDIKPDRCPQPMLDVVKSATDTYETTDVNLFKLKIILPTPDSTVALHSNFLPACLPILPVAIKVQITDFNDQPLQINKILNTGATAELFATLNTGGETSSITLTPDPTDDTAFVGLFNRPSQLGINTLMVSIGEIYRYKEYRPSEKEVTAVFNRQDPLLQKPWFYRVLLSILALILCGLSIYFAWLKTFTLAGYLLFKRFDNTTMQNTECRVGIGRGKRKLVLKKNQLPVQIKADFSSISVLNQSAKGNGANRLAVINATFDSSSRTMVDNPNPSVNLKNWDIAYIYGRVADRKDFYPLWLIAIIVLTLLAIGLSMSLPGCGYIFGQF